MATMLETPSRIWRRIQDIEGHEVPSLPSMDITGFGVEEDISEEATQEEDTSLPLQSTPTSMEHTSRPHISSASTSRFAQSLASRSNKSSTGPASVHSIHSRQGDQYSFEVPSIPHIDPSNVLDSPSDGQEDAEEQSKSSVPEVYLPPMDDEDNEDFSLTDALRSVSRSSSPPNMGDKSWNGTPKKNYDFSASLKSEPKPSPFDKYRNVALRRTNPRARTPSLSRASSSTASSSGHSTPKSDRSLVLPTSAAGSPITSAVLPDPNEAQSPDASQAPEHEEGNSEHDISQGSRETRSMDITDVHISPPRLDGGGYEEEATQEDRQGGGRGRSQGSSEPTFSSDGEDATPYAINSKAVATVNTSNVSSPSFSIAFTPTPALPRPRARFDLPPVPADLLATPAPKHFEADVEETPQREVPATPYNRPSFLLSVINSTARPHMTAGTPHPRKHQPDTATSAVESTPGPSSHGTTSSDVTPAPLGRAFTGITPRPRMALARRMSHPLSQAITAGSTTSSGGSGLSSSPYDGTMDKASFISTASSHDLTTHHQRANTSFDPAMGFGAGAPANKFNANKLNTYLHGLNRKLQEENEALIMRVMEAEKQLTKQGDSGSETAVISVDSEKRRLSGGSRRRSSVGTVLGNVQEDIAEGWLEEKAELEEMVEAFRQEATDLMDEKEELEKALEQERAEKEREKERWKERMAEFEQGVTDIVAGLEEKLKTAVNETKKAHEDGAHRLKEMERAIAEVEGERDDAMDRAQKAERLLESGKELGGALAEANERVGRVMGDLRNANSQIKELEEVVMQSDARIDQLETEGKEDKDTIAALEEELASSSDALTAERAKIGKLESTIGKLDEELQRTKAYADELEQGASDAVGKIEELEEDLQMAQETIKTMTMSKQHSLQDFKALQTEALKAKESARQMEEALEEAEQKMMHDEGTITELQNRLASMERERQKAISDSSRDLSRSRDEVVYTAAEFEALEQELDDANKEKARLRALLDQSPARKAIEKAKDLKIELLEREKEELFERNKAMRMTFNEMATPNKLMNTSGISPIHRHVLNMSIRAPKTPGGPLRDMSWLNTINDPSLTPLVSELRRVQGELDRANDSIDDKLDKLEDAGIDVVSLTRELEDTRAKIVGLEDEIARLTRKEERRTRRLSRVRCQKCNIKVDFRQVNQGDESSMELSNDGLATEPPTPPTRTSEGLKSNLQSVNLHLEQLRQQWEVEKKKLLGEKAILEDAASRLNGQIKSTKEEARRAAEVNRAAEKTKGNVQNELERAKQTISVLETELSSERSRLRAMMTEQDRMQRDKKQILTDIKRTESDMDDIRQQLQKFKKENQRLEKELRENVNADQRARLLEVRVVENADTIEQLRQERALLVTEHKDLQKKFSEVSESANKLRTKYSSQSASHESRRQELDLHRVEIDELRNALEARANDLERVEKEKEKMSVEKNDVTRTVATLEADLRRVRRDAEAFGRDLKLLKDQRDKLESDNREEIKKAERAKKQAQTQIRLLNEQLEAQKEKAAKAMEQMQHHVCSADDTQLSTLKLHHNRECKGLMVQIRYLKAKFTRESMFREDLTYQKDYLLVLLRQFEKSERNIFVAIARIGFPLAPPAPPKKRINKFRSAVKMVIFMSRIRKGSQVWRETRASKKQIAEALDDVRRRRTITAPN